MVPCLHQDNIYIKRKLRVWRAQKYISLVGAKSPLTCAARQTTPSQLSRYRVEYGNLRKLVWTYRHGTMFAPRKILHQKEATGMTAQKCISVVGSKSPLTCVGRQSTVCQGRQYRGGNGNLRKFGCTYGHGTVFAPRQYLHQKEATGMESPEMYFASRSKKPSYLCGPSSYRESSETA